MSNYYTVQQKVVLNINCNFFKKINNLKEKYLSNCTNIEIRNALIAKTTFQQLPDSQYMKSGTQ